MYYEQAKERQYTHTQLLDDVVDTQELLRLPGEHRIVALIKTSGRRKSVLATESVVGAHPSVCCTIYSRTSRREPTGPCQHQRSGSSSLSKKAAAHTVKKSQTSVESRLDYFLCFFVAS